MILFVVITVLFIRGTVKMYRRSVARNAALMGNYLYEVIRAANRR